ncbi:hypothetical protein P4O66_002516 [Electrophorus voltai]|uniref:Reverse transcriptase domain-containing protein n=1 Tax=Electrophorus voltai TaxID=2609070 RepID=A0AAD8YX60_9TELE|nr:hypothetical protein P4O66_002516 [Electrophorus voltai]
MELDSFLTMREKAMQSNLEILASDRMELTFNKSGYSFLETSRTPHENTIFLFLHNNHYYSVENIEGLLGFHYVCRFCYKGFTKNQNYVELYPQPEFYGVDTMKPKERQDFFDWYKTNLFFQGKTSRTINLNTNYMILFKNPRDKSQIQSPLRSDVDFKKCSQSLSACTPSGRVGRPCLHSYFSSSVNYEAFAGQKDPSSKPCILSCLPSLDYGYEDYGYREDYDDLKSLRAYHSTENALTEVLNDLRPNRDASNLSILVLLDLSVAFDTADHVTLNWLHF